MIRQYLKNEVYNTCFAQLELEKGEEIQFPYLVRGAELYCSCGTHKRKLNLPTCHGVYTNGKPMMHEEDCEVGDDKNIPSFGICQSEENPVNKSWFAKAGDKIKDFFTGEEDTDDAEKIADMLHELPDFSNAEWAAASDAFCGDNAISYEYEQKSFNLQKENPVEVLNVHCTVQDQAGNEKKADYEVTVTYTGLDAAALIEKTGLILQTSDVTANEKKSGKSDKKSGTTNTQNQVSQASGKSNTNSLGITDDELVEMFNSMTPDEIDEFLNSLFEDNSNDNSNISGYYDSNYAQQVFAMVNQERANNGVDALTWDSSMASYSDRRAMEITTDFSHNSAGGKMNVGENIAEGAISPEMVMDGWMRSDGHRANILNASYTKISVSCYYDGSTYYWVQNFAY